MLRTILRAALPAAVLLTLAVGVDAASQQRGRGKPGAARVNPNAATIKEFLKRVDGYVEVHKKQEATLPALPKQTTDTAWASFSGLFRSRTLATALWVACAAFLAVTLLVSSIQMTTTDVSAPLTMYRYTVADAAEPAPVAPPAVDSLRLGKLNPSGGFFVPWPFGRRAWVGTSAQRQSREVRIYPWIPVRLTYPDDFGAPAMLAVLPTGSLLEEIGKAEPPRLIVRSDSGGGAVIAEDTLRTNKAIVFSFAASQPVDSIARRTWLDATQSRPMVLLKDEQTGRHL